MLMIVIKVMVPHTQMKTGDSGLASVYVMYSGHLIKAVILH